MGLGSKSRSQVKNLVLGQKGKLRSESRSDQTVDHVKSGSQVKSQVSGKKWFVSQTLGQVKSGSRVKTSGEKQVLGQKMGLRSESGSQVKKWVSGQNVGLRSENRSQVKMGLRSKSVSQVKKQVTGQKVGLVKSGSRVTNWSQVKKGVTGQKKVSGQKWAPQVKKGGLGLKSVYRVNK